MHLYLASSSGSRDQDLSVLRKIVSLVRFFDVLKLTAVYANTTISFWGIQLTKWNTSFQNLFFSSSGFPEWGAYTVKTFSKHSPKTIFRTSALSLCLSTLTTLSTYFSATNIPTPSDFALLPIQNSLYLLPIVPKNLHPQPLNHVSWIHATSNPLSAKRPSVNAMLATGLSYVIVASTPVNVHWKSHGLKSGEVCAWWCSLLSKFFDHLLFLKNAILLILNSLQVNNSSTYT